MSYPDSFNGNHMDRYEIALTYLPTHCFFVITGPSKPQYAPSKYRYLGHMPEFDTGISINDE